MVWCYQKGNDTYCLSCNKTIRSKPSLNCSKQHFEVYKNYLLRSKIRSNELRLKVIRAYGSKCVCCGFNDINKKIFNKSYLQIDHINGGGYKHIKNLHKSRTTFYLWLKINNYPGDYRVLCWPCNVGMESGKNKCELHKEILSIMFPEIYSMED